MSTVGILATLTILLLVLGWPVQSVLLGISISALVYKVLKVRMDLNDEQR